MILQITTRKIDVYEGNVADVDRKFKTLIMRVDLNREKWKIGVVDKLIPGRDGIVSAEILRVDKNYHERPIQFYSISNTTL